MNLQKLKNSLEKDLYGITKEEALNRNICIDCKQPPTFYSREGRSEYKISGYCEPCFDKLTGLE